MIDSLNGLWWKQDGHVALSQTFIGLCFPQQRSWDRFWLTAILFLLDLHYCIDSPVCKTNVAILSSFPLLLEFAVQWDYCWLGMR